ncbi:hypothetical protein GB931_16150 [Modestobacter sp. I12A-02628]|uniref:Right-handed parallel beta-helix repeat-containing protein n=1 Tax=Goekera deserti TaxID=2497753 RepID=A0A7K3WGI8_9ACTN|nr:right-handed parallel beta-helix repeat-containing protein [Goekera deserti]MPQ99422.1 hypothetical protein [Goekera deserti]NDI48909.1 hypothetical protein [Goekera deserti]NEL55621.1 right-handed parallel beta-helix repeat-containing protein [Goekera deserti]
MTVPPTSDPGGVGHADGGDVAPAPGRRLGRRGFIAGAVVGGSVATAAVVGRVTAGDERVAVAAPAGSTVLAGRGIDPTGTTDSTAGLQAVVDAAADGARLWLPDGVHLVDGVVLRAGQTLSGPSARTYAGRAGSGARLRARAPGMTAPVLTVGAFGRVTDIAVEGQGRTGPAVRPAGFGVVLDRVTMTDGSVGYDGDYVSGTVLTGCQVHENDVGIKDVVDSMIVSCTVNANGSEGISLGAGANDNTLLGNKVEWNDGHGIDVFQALHNVVVGGVVDRNGRTGIRVVECEHTTVTGVVLRRNGRLAEDSPEDDCHLYQRDCRSFLLTGVATGAGRDDDDAGYRSPSVAVREEGGADVGYIGNELTGQTSGVAVAGAQGASRTHSMLNIGVAGVQDLPGSRAFVAGGEFSTPALSSGSLPVALGGVPTGSLGTAYRVRLVARDGADGSRAAAETTLLVSRDDGPAAVTVGAVQNVVGTSFGTTDGVLQVSASVQPDGAVLEVSVRNTGPTAWRVGLEVT